MSNKLMKADFGIIGGSSTLSLDFPDAIGDQDVTVIGDGLVFDTPFGTSPSFKLFSVKTANGEKRVLTCKMHGWRQGVTRAQASRQVFYVFQQAGIKRILAEGGVGSISRLLKLRDLVIPDDYIDVSMRKDVGLYDEHLLVMRDPICRDLSRILAGEAEKIGGRRVFERGVYVCTDGRHFESVAEVNMYRIAGGDIIGQSICPEVYLAREIGACYAGIYQVVNFAEGVIKPWEHEDLRDIFFNESMVIGRILLQTVKAVPENRDCQCAELRKETLLKGIYTKK